jgi:hypothetical protein
MPPVLTKLKYLNWLDLSENELYGRVPHLKFNNDYAIQFDYCDLSSNNFQCPLPKDAAKACIANCSARTAAPTSVPIVPSPNPTPVQTNGALRYLVWWKLASISIGFLCFAAASWSGIRSQRRKKDGRLQEKVFGDPLSPLLSAAANSQATTTGTDWSTNTHTQIAASSASTAPDAFPASFESKSYLSLLKANPSHLRIAEKLGCGTHSDVYAAIYTVPGRAPRRVAVKQLRIVEMTLTSKAQVEKEIEVMLSVQKEQSANVVEVLGVCMDPSARDAAGAPLGVSIVMKLYAASLSDLIHEAGSGAGADGAAGAAVGAYVSEDPRNPRTHEHLSVQRKMQILYDVSNGMCSLHACFPRPITHRDLKPGNILIGESGSAVIGDFGMSRAKDLSLPNTMATAGSPTVGTLCYR